MGSTPARSPDAAGFVALEGGDSRVEVVPDEGGRVRSLHLFGREWLVPAEGPGDQDLLGGGGWVEGTPEPLRQRPEVAVTTEAGAHRISCTWRGREHPWELRRALLVRRDGAVEARYEALNRGTAKLPFAWNAGLLFPLDARTRLQLPEGAPFRRAEGAESTWPRLTLDGRERDLGKPWTVPGQQVLAGWLALGRGRSTLQVWQGDERLTVTCDGDGVPYCGVTIDRGGLATAPRRGLFGRKARGAPALLLRPALGVPDGHGGPPDAAGAWPSVAWLAPGETRRWTMTLRGGS